MHLPIDCQTTKCRCYFLYVSLGSRSSERITPVASLCVKPSRSTKMLTKQSDYCTGKKRVESLYDFQMIFTYILLQNVYIMLQSVNIL